MNYSEQDSKSGEFPSIGEFQIPKGIYGIGLRAGSNSKIKYFFILKIGIKYKIVPFSIMLKYNISAEIEYLCRNIYFL
jgi:hypothetical protein